jgi:hypothetical protein
MSFTEKKEMEGQELSQFGFVHVTGLKVTNRLNPDGWTIEASVAQCGTYATNNGYVIVVTKRGNVWLSYGAFYGDRSDECHRVIDELCYPEKRGDQGMMTSAVVIIDCTEQIHMYHLMSRLADPSWDPDHH